MPLFTVIDRPHLLPCLASSGLWEVEHSSKRGVGPCLRGGWAGGACQSSAWVMTAEGHLTRGQFDSPGERLPFSWAYCEIWRCLVTCAKSASIPIWLATVSPKISSFFTTSLEGLLSEDPNSWHPGVILLIPYLKKLRELPIICVALRPKSYGMNMLEEWSIQTQLLFRISSQAKIFSPLLFWRVESHMLPFSKCHVVYIWPRFYSWGSWHQIRRAVSQMGNVTTQGHHREEKFGVTATSFTSEPNSGLSFD